MGSLQQDSNAVPSTFKAVDFLVVCAIVQIGIEHIRMNI
ncbi:MAG: hypothetical protein ACJAXY_000758 [Nonlabens sp.]|jgi:hypothetical protein